MDGISLGNLAIDTENGERLGKKTEIGIRGENHYYFHTNRLKTLLYPLSQSRPGPQHGRDVLRHVPAEERREPDDDEHGYGREEELCVVEKW